MMLNRAATVLGATLLLAAALTTAEAATDEKKETRKTKGIFGKLMEKTHGGSNADADANVGGDILAEDEGYWERFLQATVDSIPSASPSAPPTPGPQCDVSVSFCRDRSNERGNGKLTASRYAKHGEFKSHDSSFCVRL